MSGEWRTKRYDDGQEVLLRTVHCDSLTHSFRLAHNVAESLLGTIAEKDFSISADPTALFIVLHAYSKGILPSEYSHIAATIDKVLDA